MLIRLQVVEFIDRVDVRAGRHFEYRVDQTILEAVYPSMQMRALFVCPGFLYDGGLGQVHDLLLDVQFDQSIGSCIFI